MKMETKQIFDIIYYVVCALLFAITLINSVIQRAKQKNISKIQALYECIPNAVINAEKLFGDKNGENKKIFVMTTLSNIALQSGTKFDYNELDKRVEDVVKATKNVNVKIANESVNNTFCEKLEDRKRNDNTNIEPVKNDGSIVVEIDKIKGGEQNGTNN